MDGWKAKTVLHEMKNSQLTQIASPTPGPAPTVASRGLPTAAYVKRTTSNVATSESRRRICRSRNDSPALSMTALINSPMGPLGKVCLHRPYSQGKHVDWPCKSANQNLKKRMSRKRRNQSPRKPSDRTWRLLVRHDAVRISSTSLRRA
jgi:hypothetical protein